LVNNQSGLAFIFNGGQNTVSNTNTASIGTISQSANGNQRLDGTQSINNQSGSEAFASQFGTNNIANINFGAGSITQKIQKNQLGSQDQTITNASITFALQTGINDATANTSHHGKSGSSSQTLVGSQVFGQNQHIANTDNAQTIQNARNEQDNMDNNIAGGTAPTTQAVFGDNQTRTNSNC
jgi:hypothetical protein